MDNSLTYWAALDADKVALRALDKVRAWRKWFRASGFAEKAAKGWRYVHGWTDANESSSRLQQGGERGQLVKAVVNGIRPLRQRTAAMVLSGAPEMQPVAANSDSAAREQADLSRGVLEHLHRVHKRDKRDAKVLALALDMGEGFLVVEWDARAGKPVAVKPVEGPDGTPLLDEKGGVETEPAEWEGDFRYWVASPFDVYRDTGLQDWDDTSWVVVRRWVSRYRLAATYPEKAERILRQDTSGLRDPEEEDFTGHRQMVSGGLSETDMVAEYVLWHLDKPELPGGLELRFLADGTPLTPVAPYPYEGDMLPVRRLAPDDVACTSLGYSNIFDALGLSEVLNALTSAMVTNTTKAAVPPILNPTGSAMSKGTPLGTGHIVINVASKDAAPFPMEMPQTPPEAYKLAEVLERWRLEGMGLNETSMGRPPYSGMAAQAMALLDAKADEYQDGLRKGFLAYLSETATFELRVLKRYAHEERIAQVAGKARQWMAKSYSAESLKLVDAVHVQPVGVAARTLAGKFGLLETFSNFGVQLRPEQIQELVQTGQYESDFEAPLANRLRIREENEWLMRGQPPPLLMARTHWLDIPEHLALLNSPNIVDKPEVVDAVLTTVDGKLELWRAMPTDLLALLGGPPPPPPGVPAGMMGMGGPGMAPGAPGEPPPGGAPPAPEDGTASPLGPSDTEPEMPQPPPNPRAA